MLWLQGEVPEDSRVTGVDWTRGAEVMRIRFVFRALSLLAMVLAPCLAAGQSPGPDELPLNSQLARTAWQALDGGNLERAIALTDSCIAEFGGQAEVEQGRLDSLGVSEPPEGGVSDATKAEIFSHGILNDVGTCHFIRATAFEKSGRNEDACEAYRAAARFHHARCWDPKGWFWSPAKAAVGKLRSLGC